jgi:glycosyltransferase involved in cell wall biosynthesis
MQKIVIISYFFEPCNLTASNRALGWAKYLNRYGFYPVIITRSWKNEIKEPKDVLKDSGEKVEIVKKENYEVHYLPYKGNLRDRIHQKKKNLFISKFLTFIGLIIQNYTIFFLPHKNIYYYTFSFLKQNLDVKKIIITAAPFNLFHFGYKLQKKLNIKWVADYRDDWTTSDLKENYNSKISFFLKLFDRKSEKKWVSTASLITSISEYYQSKISHFVGVEGVEIINGFFEINNNYSFKKQDSTVFQITYSGSLYNTQNIELFLEALLEVINENVDIKLNVNFPGLSFSKKQEKRVLDYIKTNEHFFNITERIPKMAVIKMQKESDILLMVGHDNIKGIPSSKIYEYISLKKPILLVSSDEDILEKTVLKSGLGLIANNKDQIKKSLVDLYDNFIFGKPLIKKVEDSKIVVFSRNKSTEKLASYLDKI